MSCNLRWRNLRTISLDCNVGKVCQNNIDFNSFHNLDRNQKSNSHFILYFFNFMFFLVVATSSFLEETQDLTCLKQINIKRKVNQI